ncbi:unnamed protein product, partial [Rotaria sordida]
GRGPTYAKDFLLLGPYQPNIKFPTINRRHFCYTWFQLYKWLEFSEMTKRAYCFVCRYAYSEGQSEKGFTVDGYNNWPVAIAKFNRHQATVSHKHANDLWVNAVKNHKNNNDVAKQLNRQHEKQTSENRLYLKEIIRTVLFLARQGLALRGHREDEESENKGNLLELLELRSLDNDFIKSKLKSLQYTHHSIQNELLYLIQENILSQIVFQIKNAKYFSIMMDESVDISRHEQVSLVIRYTDDQFHVYERFIGFQRASSTTGEALFKLLVTWLKQLDLDINNIVGQCFDGASAMRGIYKGVSTRLLQIVPTALYVHCNGHILNLCLVDLSQAVVPIRNNFVSAKRHKVFEDIQKEAGLVSISLKALCDTRWSCRFESLKVISRRYTEIVATLQEIQVGDAFILLKVIQTFDFIFHIHLMSEVFLITNILSKFLQKSGVSLTEAMAQVKMTICSLESMRNDDEFNRIWNETMNICAANDIDEPAEQRRRKIPARLGGGDILSTTLSAKDNYRINSFYAVLDLIITSIKERFNENSLSIMLLCEKLFLTNVFLNDLEAQQIAQFYNMNYDELRSEQRFYKVALGQKKQMNLTSATKFFVENNFHQSLNTMNNLLKILWTIPANTCECERSFSSLRRLKTYIRNTTGQERLSSLALINIERSFDIDLDLIVTEFVSKNKERKKIF